MVRSYMVLFRSQTCGSWTWRESPKRKRASPSCRDGASVAGQTRDARSSTHEPSMTCAQTYLIAAGLRFSTEPWAKGGRDGVVRRAMGVWAAWPKGKVCARKRLVDACRREFSIYPATHDDQTWRSVVDWHQQCLRPVPQDVLYSTPHTTSDHKTLL